MDEKNVLEVQGGQAFNVASEGMFTLTHVIYALHAVAVAIGLFGAATIVGSFVSGAPSIVAVILNYLNRGAVRGYRAGKPLSLADPYFLVRTDVGDHDGHPDLHFYWNPLCDGRAGDRRRMGYLSGGAWGGWRWATESRCLIDDRSSEYAGTAGAGGYASAAANA